MSGFLYPSRLVAIGGRMIMTWMMDIGVTQQESWVWYVGAVVRL